MVWNCNPMDEDKRIEELLNTHMELEQKVNSQNRKILELEAHKRALIAAMANNESSKHYPNYIEKVTTIKLIQIESDKNLFIYNKAQIVRQDSANNNNNKVIPNNYMAVRRFMKSKMSDSLKTDVFYTTTAFMSNNIPSYVIKDDENNIWKGRDVFSSFSNSFEMPIPFESLEQWCGLDNPEVIKLFRDFY